MTINNRYNMEMIVHETKSGMWLAEAQDRPDIMASGMTKEEACENLKEMYQAVVEYETNEPQTT